MDLDQAPGEFRNRALRDRATLDGTRPKKGRLASRRADEKQSTYQATTAALNSAKANVERLVALQGFKNVTAPFQPGGSLRAPSTSDRSFPQESGTAGHGVLFTLAKTNPLDIFVNVPQTDVPSIHEGLPARLLVPEYPNRDFEAKVVRTAGALDPASAHAAHRSGDPQ